MGAVSGTYRLWLPCEVLGVHADDDDSIQLRFDRPWEGGEPPMGVQIVGVEELPDADVVVLQRPTHWSRVRLVELLQQAGIAVVVEIDDDYHSLPQGHPGREVWSPRLNPERNKKWLAECCRRADLVTVTTRALAERYGAHGRVAVIPNYVPESYLTVEGKPNDEVTVGWPGSPITHTGDLEVCGNGVADAQRIAGFAFRAIGGLTTCERLGVEGETVEWVELADYPQTVASLDVGIVPLASTKFNWAKSSLKCSEYAALGVPHVMSPTPDNLRMHAHGIGLIARTPSDWREALVALATSEHLRDDMAAKGREAMAAFTVEGNAWRWWEAWEQARRNADGRKAA